MQLRSTKLERAARGRAGGPGRITRKGIKRARRALEFRWAKAITPEQWTVYQRAIEAVEKAGLPLLLGGGFALAAFVGRWRDTKDIDLYVKPDDRHRAIEALTRAGFDDYYERLPYDRKWIYRSVRNDVIVDVIWSMANQRAQVDDLWFERARSLNIRGRKLKVIPPEEFMWCKLYIMQRDHCDWTDVLNLLYAKGTELDWDHLIWRLEEDTPLLRALLLVYSWLCPKTVLDLPPRLWTRLGLSRPQRAAAVPKCDRLRLLDSRAWFAALLESGQKLEV